MSDAENSRYLPDLYWKRLGQLKGAAICMRLYRNRLASYVRFVELVKAVASCGAIACWAIWRDYPLVWAAIIAASQFLDATKHIFPFARCTVPRAISLLRSSCYVSTLRLSGKAYTPAIFPMKVSLSGGHGSKSFSCRQSKGTFRTDLIRPKR